MLEVVDVDASVDFYTDVLGFTCYETIADGAPPVVLWAGLRREEVGLMVTKLHTHDEGGEHDHEHPAAPVLTGSLYIDVDDVDELALDLGGKAPLAWGPVDQPYGQREIAVVDPDGYLLVFGMPARA